MIKAVFIDRDGTLIKNRPFNIDPSLVELDDCAVDALKLMQQNDFLIIVIANQGGIAKGNFTAKQVDAVNARIASMLAENEVYIDAFYYSPFHPDGIIAEFAKNSDDRKPSAGMLLKAASSFGIDLSHSWVIGDLLDDMEAGHRAGCTTILYNNENETDWRVDRFRQPDYIVNDLYKAACAVCEISEPSIVNYEFSLDPL
ncbi:D,D-heptose 1,7-bisphosphate phosphatase [Filimonas lacunae]|uniref:D,D-heptose 1,7-bisphosphate phosphatase n=1 Tax=Filimonas lacunae TaxID=477680 RepID=A0A173MMH8_9BACT|nr:HAD family hydrolase [Filimonas lacunae]BAV08687.1 D-glycero-D-manno-heptose 1,7-bisphosphate phosphatase [Filimonas lacunae]SIS59984.1 D,D-heptose 1,7-bisphosphate phosphatase [Filimonas lacunae]